MLIMGLGPWQEAQAESSSGDGRRQGMGGSVVEFSPATREARVRFPANAVAILLILRDENFTLPNKFLSILKEKKGNDLVLACF